MLPFIVVLSSIYTPWPFDFLVFSGGKKFERIEINGNIGAKWINGSKFELRNIFLKSIEWKVLSTCNVGLL